MCVCKTKVYAASVKGLYSQDVFEKFYKIMPETRRRKTDKLKNKRDKCLSIGAELLLLYALKQEGICDYKVEYTEKGKPFIKGNPLFLSLSHSGEMVMCAISTGTVGCDIQRMTDADISVSKRFFSAEEADFVFQYNNDLEKRNAFFRMWTLKESFSKAVGGCLFKDFSVDIKGEKISVRQSLENGVFNFKEYKLGDEYCCAVCGVDHNFEQIKIVEIT